MKSFVVVIAEDEETIASMLSQIVKQNFTNDVTIAKSYSQALGLLGEIKPDLMFIDVNLGDGNGYDLLKVLKANKKQAGKVIMMSAYANDMESAEESAAGVDRFISKPFDKGEVILAIRNVLKLENGEAD